jgi:hypothetical protein
LTHEVLDARESGLLVVGFNAKLPAIVEADFKHWHCQHSLLDQLY